jgi:hypothetical protein
MMATSFSLFAPAEVLQETPKLSQARLLVPQKQANANQTTVEHLGSGATLGLT